MQKHALGEMSVFGPFWGSMVDYIVPKTKSVFLTIFQLFHTLLSFLTTQVNTTQHTHTTTQHACLWFFLCFHSVFSSVKVNGQIRKHAHAHAHALSRVPRDRSEKVAVYAHLQPTVILCLVGVSNSICVDT